MGKRSQLSTEEVKKIVQLSTKLSSLEISKKLKRDHRTIKKFLTKGEVTRARLTKTKPKALSPRDERKLKRTLRIMPHATSKMLFEKAGLKKISKTTRNVYLQKIGNIRKMKNSPVLTSIHKMKRIDWARKFIKQDFHKVIWSDECRATLDGPDGWSKGWLLTDMEALHRFKRQQGGGGVMFWAAIIKDEIIGPFRLQKGVKINSITYCEFLKTNFLPWLRNRNDKNELIFMHDNAPAHSSRYTKGFICENEQINLNVMEWPPNSPDLNPIENLWSAIKRKVYENGKQYNSIDSLWKKIKEAFRSVDKNQILKLTNSVDERILKIIETGGRKINF